MQKGSSTHIVKDVLKMKKTRSCDEQYEISLFQAKNKSIIYTFRERYLKRKKHDHVIKELEKWQNEKRSRDVSMLKRCCHVTKDLKK
jgi:hypothetical protein